MPQNDSCNKDAIDRKISAFERILNKFFEEARKDFKGFALVLSVVGNIALGYAFISYVVRSANDRVDEITRIVKRQVMDDVENTVEKKVEQKTESIGDKVDNATKSLQELTETVKNEVIK